MAGVFDQVKKVGEKVDEVLKGQAAESQSAAQIHHKLDVILRLVRGSQRRPLRSKLKRKRRK